MYINKTSFFFVGPMNTSTHSLERRNKLPIYRTNETILGWWKSHKLCLISFCNITKMPCPYLKKHYIASFYKSLLRLFLQHSEN